MPAICEAALTAIDVVEKNPLFRKNSFSRTDQLRRGLEGVGYHLGGGGHPIVPVIVGQESTAVHKADLLRERGLFVVPFSFPVVLRGQARIRTQVSAAHSADDISFAIDMFSEVGRSMGMLPGT